GAGRLLHLCREWIGLHANGPLAREHLELVECARVHVWQEDFPHARTAHGAHREDASVPTAEVSDDTHATRIRRPHSETDAVDASARPTMRAELAPQLPMRAFVEEM